MCGAMWCQMCGAKCVVPICGAKYVVPNVWCQYVWCQGIPRNLARFGGFPRDLDDITGHVTRTDQSEAEFGAGSGRKWHPKGSGSSKKTEVAQNTRNPVYTTLLPCQNYMIVSSCAT